MSRFASDVKFSSAVTPAEGVSAATPLNGSVLDMAGWRSVCMIVTFGAITGLAVTSIKAQQGAADDLSDAADLADTEQTVADDADNTTFYIDIRRPTKRYVRLVVSRGTQAATVANALYMQYEGRRFPVTQPAGFSGEAFSHPDEGTA